MAGASHQSVDAAFADVPELRTSIHKALIASPQFARLFDDISKFVLSIKQHSNVLSRSSQGGDAPPTKKRRLDEPASSQQQQPLNGGPRRLLLEAREITFVSPQRKKLHLGFVQYGLSFDETKSMFAIQGRNPASNQVEFEYPITSYTYAFRLPVPEKTQKQYNFCLLPTTENAPSVEPLIWTVNHGPLKSCKIEDPELTKIAQGPEDELENAVNAVMGKTGVKLTLPSEKEFASAVRESHRKNDIAYHVRAHRGSKEGYLFFLETGIFFGFKKPLNFFPFNEIESISYTSVLQRTFNLNINIRTPNSDMQDIEFAMLDQADFAGIDAYIKAHQLQDASLAEARRAKKVGKTIQTDTNSAEGDDKTELEKAEQELEDEEDEMEEDYEPDEDEDASGSDSGSDEEEYKLGKGRNLVAEELGSEAEDVSASEGEDGEAEEEEEVGDDVDELHADHQPIPTHSIPKTSGVPDLEDEDQL